MRNSANATAGLQQPDWANPWVVANWKMNPVTTDDATLLVKSINDKLVNSNRTCNIVLAPSFLHLSTVATLINPDTALFQLAAQNLCAYASDTGAYTGEVSAKQLADMGISHVIIGHSERRQYFNESNDVLSKKIACAMAADLDVILCVGETANDYDNQATSAVITEQLAVLKNFAASFAFNVDDATKSRLMIAYEPVWAIGTGKVPTLNEVNDVHRMIQETLASYHDKLQATPILYGGSVKADNATEFAGSPFISGVLVGGASLNAESFYQIIDAFSQK